MYIFPIVRIVLQTRIFSVAYSNCDTWDSGGIPLLPLSSCSLVPRTFFFFFHFLLIGPDIFLFILTVLGMRLSASVGRSVFSFCLSYLFLLPFFFSRLKENRCLFAIGQNVLPVCFHLQSTTICKLDSKLLVIPLMTCRIRKVQSEIR